MRVPYERWLKCLLQFQGMTSAQVILVADSYGFIPPTADTITFIRGELSQTRPSPFHEESAEAIRWIREQGLWGMARGAEHVTAARAILGQLQLRRTLDFLLAANTPHADVAAYAKDITGAELSEATVAAYEHYFWDVNLLNHRQWVTFFKAEFAEERQAQMAAGVRPKDLTLPFMSKQSKKLLDTFRLRSPEFAMWQLGYRVDVQRGQVLGAMFHYTATRFTETSLMNNNLHTAQTAKLWSEILNNADDRLSGSEDRTKELLNELRSLRIRTKDAKVSSIDDLRGA